VSKGALDIDGIGQKQIGIFLGNGLIVDALGLYAITEVKLLELERFAKKSAYNIVTAIQNSKTQPFSRVLVALGIRHVGTENASLLAGHFKSMDSLASASKEALSAVEGIGPVIAGAVWDFFQNETNRILVMGLAKAGLQMEIQVESAIPQSLMGMRFVITGRLQFFDRTEIHEFIKVRGGVVSGSVSKKSNYVVVGTEAGSKAAEAVRLDVPILSEGEFVELVKELEA
jgi:DNA ligase (NAD+)